jgi:2-polyprenyl-3-methyl-5-hydroxy-6-metoxy-1,4-benzoquinol methylase
MSNIYENSSWDSSVPIRPGGIKLTGKLLEISGIKKGLILDFGCGYGHTARYLINKKFDVIGTDKSEKLINEAALRCPEAEFIISKNPEELNFPDKFDGIISECVISSLENKKKIINKIYTLLKHNGIFIINDIMALVKKEPRNFLTFHDWIDILTVSGFEIIYHENNTTDLKQFYLKALWENNTDCIADCIPKGYKAKETGYFSIIAKKI